ncbi:glycosyltransferase, partial [Tamlana sp. PT2-4]|nr:glycosyltransferase [Tamlana laminarinivorans]
SKLAEGGVTERLIEELGIDDIVRTVSGIDDIELAALLGSAEIAAVPSLYEGFSLPAVEAMACGTPLVASRAGAIPEVVGDAGVLVPPGDGEQLAAALA